MLTGNHDTYNNTAFLDLTTTTYTVLGIISAPAIALLQQRKQNNQRGDTFVFRPLSLSRVRFRYFVHQQSPLESSGKISWNLGDKVQPPLSCLVQLHLPVGPCADASHPRAQRPGGRSAIHDAHFKMAAAVGRAQRGGARHWVWSLSSPLRLRPREPRPQSRPSHIK